MKAIFARLAVVGLLMLLVGPMSLTAQDVSLNDRLYYIEGNTLMALQLSTGESTSVITDLPRMLDRALSPTNDFMVYRAEPEMFAEEIAAECPCGGGELPSDLVLIDLITGETTLIAGQPEDTTLSTGITRSDPVWSPDGTQLAWAEGLEFSTLVIYDRLTGETIRGTDTIPPQTLVSSTAKLTGWTQTGILVETVDFGATLTENIVGYRMYQPDGTLLSEIAPQFDDPFSTVIRYGDSEVLGIKRAAQDWIFLDIITGNPVNIETGRFATYATGAPDSSLRWLMPTILNADIPILSFEIRDAENNILGEIESGEPELAPFGSTLLLQSNNRMTIWRNPEDTTTIELPTGFTVFDRVPVQFEIVETDTPLVTIASCEGSQLDIRLLGESNGYVLGDTPNNVREEPNTSAAIAGQVVAGDWFDIIDGPSCADGISWWRVSTPGVSGWTAEGVGDEYFIQPGCPEGGCTRG